MNISKPFVIFSAERSDRGAAINADLTAQLGEQLTERGIAHTAVCGRYKDTAEVAYLCPLPGNGRAGAVLAQIAGLANRYGQETVLYVDSNRQACLYEVRNGWALAYLRELGPWQEITHAEASRKDAYTEHGGRFFVAGK